MVMQLDFFDVPSPCKGICAVDERGYCLGCFRSRDERFDWNSYDVAQKQKVVKLCLQREKRKAAKQNNVDTTKPAEVDNTLQPSLLDPPKKTKQTNGDIDFTDFEL